MWFLIQFFGTAVTYTLHLHPCTPCKDFIDLTSFCLSQYNTQFLCTGERWFGYLTVNFKTWSFFNHIGILATLSQMITKAYCNICFSVKKKFLNTTLLLPWHCIHFLLETKPHINIAILLFPLKILKLKHKKLNTRHYERFSNYRKMGVDEKTLTTVAQYSSSAHSVPALNYLILQNEFEIAFHKPMVAIMMHIL